LTIDFFVPTDEKEVADLLKGVNLSQDSIELKLKITNVAKKDFLGASDPYLVLSRSGQPKPVQIAQTEVRKKTLTTEWELGPIPLAKFTGGDLNTQIIIECFDWDSDIKSEFIGSTKVSLLLFFLFLSFRSLLLSGFVYM
jgi:Ca2+-dependent lipid-binding protein